MEKPNQPEKQLSLFDSVCIIIGIIIGAGIYETTPFIAANSPSPAWMLAAWLIGGAVSLCGALCYAELTTSYPRDGGDYNYLTLGFNRHSGFMFVWCDYWIIRPANIGMMGFVFARYFDAILAPALSLADDSRPYRLIALASSSIVLLTALNLLGVRAGKWTQNVLTVVKILGLLAVFFVGAMLANQGVETAFVEIDSGAGFSVAMVLVLFTFGGWNEISYVAAEVREPRKNLLWSLVIGVLAITFIYVALNFVFWQALGFEGMRNSNAIASDTVTPMMGSWGGAAVSLLICLSSLGAMNGLIFSGSRLYFAMGAEHRFFSWVGVWNAWAGAPLRSLAIQSIIAIGLVLAFGWYDSGFSALLMFAAPVVWVFALMVGIALFILRRQKADVEHPFRVMLYPWLPIIFCLFSAFLAVESFKYAFSNRTYEGLWSILIIIIGAVVSFVEAGGVKKG